MPIFIILYSLFLFYFTYCILGFYIIHFFFFVFFSCFFTKLGAFNTDFVFKFGSGILFFCFFVGFLVAFGFIDFFSIKFFFNLYDYIYVPQYFHTYVDSFKVFIFSGWFLQDVWRMDLFVILLYYSAIFIFLRYFVYPFFPYISGFFLFSGILFFIFILYLFFSYLSGDTVLLELSNFMVYSKFSIHEKYRLFLVYSDKFPKNTVSFHSLYPAFADINDWNIFIYFLETYYHTYPTDVVIELSADPEQFHIASFERRFYFNHDEVLRYFHASTQRAIYIHKHSPSVIIKNSLSNSAFAKDFLVKLKTVRDLLQRISIVKPKARRSSPHVFEEWIKKKW